MHSLWVVVDKNQVHAILPGLNANSIAKYLEAIASCTASASRPRSLTTTMNFFETHSSLLLLPGLILTLRLSKIAKVRGGSAASLPLFLLESSKRRTWLDVQSLFEKGSCHCKQSAYMQPPSFLSNSCDCRSKVTFEAAFRRDLPLICARV